MTLQPTVLDEYFDFVDFSTRLSMVICVPNIGLPDGPGPLRHIAKLNDIQDMFRPYLNSCFLLVYPRTRH